MQQVRHRRFASLLTAAAIFALSVGAGAISFFQFQIPDFDLVAGELFQLNVDGLSNTGFSIRSRDGSTLTLTNALTQFEPEVGLEGQQRVQNDFLLLDGTLSLNVTAQKTLADGSRVRGRMLTTYRLDVRRPTLRRESLARKLFDRGLAPDLTSARSRARYLRVDDARLMRLVRRPEGARWKRAVRVIPETRGRLFRPRLRPPDDELGHFGLARSANGDPYVWAVMDRNSKYAVGLYFDRDGDDINNWADNCIGSPNSDQQNTDNDNFGNACDNDDDNDTIADASDNCSLDSNTDQSDQDEDGTGDACDADDDNDNVLDGADACQATAVGSVVAANGCSIADTCPCENSWRNHGAYVKCVAQTSGSFLSAGLITSAQKDAIVSSAAQSVCGS